MSLFKPAWVAWRSSPSGGDSFTKVALLRLLGPCEASALPVEELRKFEPVLKAFMVVPQLGATFSRYLTSLLTSWLKAKQETAPEISPTDFLRELVGKWELVEPVWTQTVQHAQPVVDSIAHLFSQLPVELSGEHFPWVHLVTLLTHMARTGASTSTVAGKVHSSADALVNEL